MRQLSISETTYISGGKSNDGYTFTFVVTNAVTIGLLGSIFLGGSFFTWAGVGAGYGLLMMGAKAVDHYYFPDSYNVTPTQNNYQSGFSCHG